jgi:hypothetical protein
MKTPPEQHDTTTPGHDGNAETQEKSSRPSGQERQEQYRRAREPKSSDQTTHGGGMEQWVTGKASSASDSSDRDQRTRRRADEP